MTLLGVKIYIKEQNDYKVLFACDLFVFVDCDYRQTMDVVLSYADEYVLTPYVYSTSWAEDNPLRQILSLFLVTNIGGYVLYFIAATLSYWFLFDKRLLSHPLILKVHALL